MFIHYDSTVKLVIKYLRLLGVKVNSETINDSLLYHPNWPSLLSISDSFQKWNIPNAAGRLVNKNEIDQLPLPFLAHIKGDETQLTIVNYISQHQIGYITDKNTKSQQESRESFFEKWDGVYLIAESNKDSGESDYHKNRRQLLLNAIIPFSLLLLLIFFSGSILSNTNYNQLYSVYLHYTILLAGVVVTSLLLWHEVDHDNQLLQKVCSGFGKVNCNAILTSKQAKLFNLISWSEIGFIYFSGSLLLLLFTTNNITETVKLMSWITLLALPYTIFSIWFQWKVAKQWCLLCVIVQILIISAALNVIINKWYNGNDVITNSILIKAVLGFAFVGLIWATIKPYLIKINQSKKVRIDYLKMKFNLTIFDALLKEQKPVTIPYDDIGIDIGDKNSKNVILKICNPYCGPCAEAHKKIENLLLQNSDLRVKLIFRIPNYDSSTIEKPAKHLLAIAAMGNKFDIQAALNDWYYPTDKNYETFSQKYPLNGELVKEGICIEAMSKWCKEMEITYTPTIFFNGYQLPNAYSIEDLEYFLLE